MPEALGALFEGTNTGKLILRLGEPDAVPAA
jgi:NADPH-dependent curcumin reductase CurA